VNCIAICEVINKDIKKSGSIWVQPNEDHVVTRFFFVFAGQADTSKAQAVNCEDPNYKKEIEAAILG
jgi:poly [ADP-ribose] polymerase 6/8